MMRRRIRGLALVLVVGSAWLLLAGAFPAGAHALMDSSDPAAGAELDTAPAQVTMIFTEPPDIAFSDVEVLNAGGQPVQSGPAVLGQAPRSMAVPLPDDLPTGVYTVSWTVVSSADGHPSAGTFAFGVGVDPGSGSAPTQQTTTPSPSAAATAGKVMLYVGILLAIGTALAGVWTIGLTLAGRRGLALVSGVATLAGASVMLFAERTALDTSVTGLLRSDTGRSYVWLLVAAGLTLIAAVALARTPARWAFASLGVAGILTAAARAAGGHAAAGSPAWIQEALQTLHMAAAGVWIGGLVPILMLLRSRRRTGSSPPVADVRRFSSAAGWAVLVVVATGVVRAVSEAGGFGSLAAMLTDTSYGTALIVKVVVVALVIALGAWNRLRSIPRLETGDRLLGRVMSIEVASALAIVVTTGVLTGLNPEPPEAAPPPAPASISASGGDFATTTTVGLTATPGLAGPNDFVATVTDYDTGEPVVATAVRLRFDAVGRPQVATSELDLTQSTAGTWRASGAELSLAGVWNVTAQVQSGASSTDVPLVLTTRPAGGQQTAVASVVNGPDILTLSLGDGLQLQCYVDPGTPGGNDVHVTAFADGTELPLADLLVVLTPEGGDPLALPVERLSEGHFSAPADLDAGSYRIDVVASAKDKSVLQGWFTTEVGADA